MISHLFKEPLPASISIASYGVLNSTKLMLNIMVPIGSTHSFINESIIHSILKLAAKFWRDPMLLLFGWASFFESTHYD